MAELKTVIRYHRSTKLYQVELRTGLKILAFSSDREEMQWSQLTDELGLDRATQLRDKADQQPAIATRLIKAGLMFAQQLATPVDWHDPDSDYQVVSQSDPNVTYQVHISRTDLTAWSCHLLAERGYTAPQLCPDIARNAPLTPHGKRCKHELCAALHMSWVWKPWDRPAANPTASNAPVACYATGDVVTPEDLAAFANFIRDRRRLPINRHALSLS